MKSGIYKITNTLNGNLYIGLSKNLTQRMSEHKSRYLAEGRQGYDSPLYRAFRKYGIENFSKKYLAIHDNPEDMFNMESKLVNKYFIYKLLSTAKLVYNLFTLKG